MVLKLNNELRPILKESSGASAMLDTGAIISVFNMDEELFKKYYPNFKNTGLNKNLGGLVVVQDYAQYMRYLK